MGLVIGVALILIVIGVLQLLKDPPNEVGGGLLLAVGMLALVLGTRLNKIKKLSAGPLSAELETALATANEQVEEGAFAEVGGGFGGTGSLTAGVTTFDAPQPQDASPEATHVFVTNGAQKVMDQLDAADKAAVESVLEQMKSSDYPGGLILPGSSRYRVEVVNANVRLVFRRKDPPMGGYVILNVVRPDTTLWRMTDRALDSPHPSAQT
jgi:hypothetical protein